MIPCIILSFTYDTNIPLYLIHERDKKYSAALYDASAFTFYRVRTGLKRVDSLASRCVSVPLIRSLLPSQI